MKNQLARARRQRGTTLIEVLVTMVILAFGLLGLAAFQSKVQLGSIESYQRAQAVILLSNMQARINGNPQNANDYVNAADVFGVDDTVTSCAAALTGAARDKCEWSVALQGGSEKKGTGNLGMMKGARGCITLIRARNNTKGSCASGIYLVSVAWEGMHETVAPSAVCAKDKYGTSNTLRRVISARVVAGTPECV